MTALKLGNLAPTFTLLNQASEKVSLKDFRSSANVVLYFYPKAMTPGCTNQACGLRDSKKQLAHFDAVALGLSPDPVKRLAKFEEKESLNLFLFGADKGRTRQAAPAVLPPASAVAAQPHHTSNLSLYRKAIRVTFEEN